jgi:tRNA(adenine34) deaminase
LIANGIFRTGPHDDGALHRARAQRRGRTVRERDESRHAEIIAIAQARQAVGDAVLARCTLYSIIEPCAMCSFCIRAAGIRRVVFALHSPVLGGMSKWNILGDRALSRRIPCLFRGPPAVVHGVLADEAMQAWSDWRPLATQAIRLFGFFVKPEAGDVNAGGLQPAPEAAD